MRQIATFAALAALLVLGACDSSTPPAKAPVTTPKAAAPAVTTPAKAPATTPAAKAPIGAQPLMGSWAADLANCGTPSAVTVVSASTYSVGGKSCDIALTANKDGSFATSCGSSKLTLMPVFAPTGEGINISVDGGKRQTVLRCSR